MKRRILAIVLVLMLAVSLLPVSAMAEDGEEATLIVGNQVFTSFGQTINVGGGTAKVYYSDGNVRLTLKNVKITEFCDIGYSEDGTPCYAGIAYAGTSPLVIEISSLDCSITAPSHSADKYYYGIYSPNRVYIKYGPLTINNTDTGVEASLVRGEFTDLNIDSVSGPAILATAVYFIDSRCTLSSKSPYVIVCDDMNIRKDADMIIKHTPDMAKYGYGDVISVLVGSKVFTESEKFTIDLNADFSGYTGNSLLQCSGILCGGKLKLNGNFNCTVNAKCTPFVMVDGVCSDDFQPGGNCVSHVNLSGEHGASTAFFADGLMKEYHTANYEGYYNIDGCYPQLLEAVLKGASANDNAIYVQNHTGNLGAHEIYAAVDDSNAAALRLPEGQPAVSAKRDGDPLNMHTPKNGSLADIEGDGFVWCTAVDENGKPANVVVLSSRLYAFRDIDGKNDVYFKDAILWAVEQGITNGVSPVEFNPSGNCTRSQIVTFLWRAMGSPEPVTAVNPFVDVKENSFYYKAVLWAYETGLTTGTDATHFSPDAVCTRAEAVTFLWRNDGRPDHGISENPFTDISDTGKCSPYYDAILWAFENGITNGTNADRFDPFGRCTRGQIVTFIYRDMAE